MAHDDEQWPAGAYRPRRFGESSPSHLHLVDDTEPPPTTDQLEHWIEMVAHPAGEDVACRRLSLAELEPSVLAPAVQRVLRRGIAPVWALGWQPAELVRHARRSLGASTAKVVLGLIALDHADRDPSTLDARWVAQLDSLEVPADGDPDWIVRRAGRMWNWSDREMLVDLPVLLARLPRCRG